MRKTQSKVKSLVLLSKCFLFLLAAGSTAVALHLSVKMSIMDSAQAKHVATLYNRLDDRQKSINYLTKRNQLLDKSNKELRAWLRPSPKHQRYLGQLREQIRIRNKKFGFDVKDELLAYYVELGI